MERLAEMPLTGFLASLAMLPAAGPPTAAMVAPASRLAWPEEGPAPREEPDGAPTPVGRGRFPRDDSPGSLCLTGAATGAAGAGGVVSEGATSNAVKAGEAGLDHRKSDQGLSGV